jgi:hypothetical protein
MGSSQEVEEEEKREQVVEREQVKRKKKKKKGKKRKKKSRFPTSEIQPQFTQIILKRGRFAMMWAIDLISSFSFFGNEKVLCMKRSRSLFERIWKILFFFFHFSQRKVISCRPPIDIKNISKVCKLS